MGSYDIARKNLCLWAEKNQLVREEIATEKFNILNLFDPFVNHNCKPLIFYLS